MDVILAITAIATTVLAAIAIYFTIRGLRKQLWLQTFSEYTGRYAEIACNLPSSARDPAGRFVFNELPAAEQEQLMNAARAYLNLCSEEHYLYEKGHIDKETWGIWSAGIRDTFRSPWLQALWPTLYTEYRAYEPFCDFARECLPGEVPTAVRRHR